jgi:hypothetical protein
MLSNFSNELSRHDRCRFWRFGGGGVVSLFFIANAFGQTAPTIFIQPQSQTVMAGTNVTFLVAVAGSASSSLPSVSSGTLQLWLRADAGVVTNASGQVSQWQDQSGNANHASQANTNQQPLLVYPTAIGGNAAVRFNGIQDNVNGDYLCGTNTVAIPDAMTSFMVYEMNSGATAEQLPTFVGAPPTYGAGRSYWMPYGTMAFSTWTYDYLTGFTIPTNTYRIWTDRYSTDLGQVNQTDDTAATETNFTEITSGQTPPAPGYYVGGLNPAVQYVVNSRCFGGDIAELIYYQGYLTDADRLAVLGYLQQKYYLNGVTNDLSYQWQINGTNIAGATNATLTLNDVQTTESGSYTVIVTNLADSSTTSSNAVLTVNSLPPCAPAPAGLVGWWPAEGNANDIVGDNNGALSNGASFGPGEVGQAFTLNGTNQYIAIPDAPALRPASLTVEGWYNFQAYDGVRVLVAKPYGPGTWDSLAVWMENGQLNAAIVTASTQEPSLTYNWSPAFGVWHHVAYTFDANAALQTIYVDGVAVASNSASGPIAYDTHPFQIGADIENGVPSFFFDGSIDEVSLYDRALTATEIAAIYDAGGEGKCGLPPTILTQPQSQSVVVGGTASFLVTTGGTAPLAYQWSFDGTNIAGATNAALVLTSLNFGDAGSYTVAVTNVFGLVGSSNAILAVGNAPSWTHQPQNQEVVQGSNVIFVSSAAGTTPLSFQWSLNGTALAQATNSMLSLTNVQAENAGAYEVTVSNPFGTAISSNAILTVDVRPVIETQPQSQAVIVGNNVTFSVLAAFPPSSVSSGTLQLWLKGDAGVVTNASGQVSQWEDQSGNTNDASQANSNLQPLLVYAAGIGGRAAVRFNGIQDGINGDYLHGTGDVAVPNAMTAFTVYNAFTDTNAANIPWLIGVPGPYGASRCLAVLVQELDFGTWAHDYEMPGMFPTNTYRICTDWVNTNLSTVEIFDTSATGATNFSAAMSSALTPSAGYYVGGLDPSLPDVSPDNFAGDLAEMIIYSGYLSDADRLGVLAYLQQKYYQGGDANGVSFQWQFDGTNIAGATNATLTLTNVQTIDAGTYSVTLTDPAGSTTSSNAVLTLLNPPVITSSPASQSVVAGTTVMFSATATGTAPVTYQWQFDGATIPGATNTSLTVTNAVISNAGSYSMVATSPYGSATSSVATLSVAESTIQVANTSAAGGGTVVVSIDLIAVGTESGVSFSLDFDPTVLTYSGVVLGSGATGGTLLSNVNQVASGRLGLAMGIFSGTFSTGTQDVFDVTFQIAAVTNAISTSLTFGFQPTGEQVSDPLAQSLPAIYLPGAVAISSSALAGDVSPRPNGNEVVNIEDWIQEGRFVAGLDVVSNGGEFQRADCAPRGAPSGGPITVADWVQVGRYAVGLDPMTAAGGPTSPSSEMKRSGHPGKDGLSRPIMLVPLSQGTPTNSVGVELVAQGDESALQFSVTFNPMLIQFVNAGLGSGAPGAALIQNTSQAASGNLGFVVGLLSPATFAAGTQQLVNLNFAPVFYSNTTALVFGDTPIPCQLVDSNADVLLATYENATLAVGGLVWPTLSINQAGSNVVLSWPSSATVFELQASSSLDGDWTNVVATPAMVGGSLKLTSPISTNTVYYRLKY